ncbi:MAG: 23S rRNA (uracil(1939)-C(5))-methyltransferase RlmD [Candidatus Thiodiazotropha sp. (ex Epidulcina cf. delphinae)]|nr:23S rRNA (uracil(1939)-C(5))-methyltransferase RlmD [Candidatus Thiodiazotropha sp. (ex Epidulcina cf. delphinae)]
MGRRRRRKQLPTEPVEAEIESLTHDGKGVAHIEGKATFIHGSLPGERVRFRYSGRRRRYDEGRVIEVLNASPQRVQPRCDQFGICGGCSLQHQDPEAQVVNKQQAMLDALRHIGKVAPAEVLPPLVSGSSWGYRRKARLGVRFVPKKGGALVGFRERGSSFVADIERCHILHPRVGELLPQLRLLIDQLSIRDQVPQIEMAMGDETCVLIFRILATLCNDDLSKLDQFARQHRLEIYLQEGGPESVRPLGEGGVALTYELPAFDLRFHFEPSDFTQVNSDINRQMVRRAVAMLQLNGNDQVLDLFCGLGNFTLPLARSAGSVTGVEGDIGLVARARENAERNGIDNTSFYTANLYETLENEPWLQRRFNKVLLDPPRSGAQEVLPQLPLVGAERIVYVSCYPDTLARDAGILVHDLGYRLISAGVMDMFPHTTHVESIALFARS